MKANKITRDEYKTIKKMDHRQMEDYLCNIYSDGVAQGVSIMKNRLSASNVRSRLLRMKGLGTTRVEQIIEILELED